MVFSETFFKQRSFEVVWAAFRVAEPMTRHKVRFGLEERAVDYLIYKDIDSLAGLEEMVHLALRVGELTKVNATVLLREIGNLRQLIGWLTQQRTLLPDSGKKEVVSAEEALKELPVLYSDFEKEFGTLPDFSGNEIDKKESGNDMTQESGNDKKEEFYSQKSPARQEHMGSVINSYTKPVQESGNIQKTQDKGALPESGNNRENLAGSPARNDQRAQQNRKESNNQGVSFRKRQQIIMELLEKRNLCHINDVKSALPGVSTRTIRYDIQRLVDRGVVERIGSGGPNSFFRKKAHSSA